MADFVNHPQIDAILAGTYIGSDKRVQRCSCEIHDYRTALAARDWFISEHPPLEGDYVGDHPRNVVAEALTQEVAQRYARLNRMWEHCS